MLQNSEQGASKFVSGSLFTGQLVLNRDDGSEAVCGVVICHGSFVDNEDGTVNVTFNE